MLAAYGIRTEDHPRGCGENVNSACFLILFKGSPPRMRGKQDRCFSAGYDGGITPADAGKTEKGKNCESSREGSPPRMRGKLRFTVPSGPRLRITPADAGKTTNGAKVVQDGQDHPRGCGEN